MRSQAREIVYKYLFSQLFNPGDEELFTVLAKNEGLNDDDYIFAKDLLDLCQTEKEKYFDKINQLAIGYNLNRIYAGDKCSILIGMVELDNYPNTPKIVIIDEAVKLSAKYSTEKSTDFVNGILAEYAKETRND